MQVYWSRDEGKNLSFYSVSSDGRVTQWILSKNELQHNDVTELKITEGIGGEREDLDASLAGLSGGTCFDFQVRSSPRTPLLSKRARTHTHTHTHAHTQDFEFIVGTEEGKIRKCSTAYNSHDAEGFEGHYMCVYSVQWNKFHGGVFLSASADWTVKLWEKNSKRPLMSFDLGRYAHHRFPHRRRGSDDFAPTPTQHPPQCCRRSVLGTFQLHCVCSSHCGWTRARL